MKAGGPYTLDIRATNHLVVGDILVGDVWFCSGQSNMVIPMERVKEKYPDDIAGADFPRSGISSCRRRLMSIGSMTTSPTPVWQEASPTSVLAFGAATYFFARRLYENIMSRSGSSTPALVGRRSRPGSARRGFPTCLVIWNRSRNFPEEEYLAESTSQERCLSTEVVHHSGVPTMGWPER